MKTLPEVCEEFQVSEWTLREWIREGLLPVFRVKGVRRIADDDLDRFRRLHTWHGAAGEKAPSVERPSRAEIAATPTGESPSQWAQTLRDAASAKSSNAAQSERRGRGSRTPSGVVVNLRDSA